MRASIITLAAVVAGVSAVSNDTLVLSTVYATSTSTILSCAATVTNCPVGKVTEVVYTTTTFCPATAVIPGPVTTPTAAPQTLTYYSTSVSTILSCAPTVTNCPVGKVTSSVYTLTSAAPTVPAGVAPTTPAGVVPTTYVAPPPAPPATTAPPATLTTSAGKSVGTVVPVISKPVNSTVPFTGGASAQKAGSVLLAVGLAAALL